MPRTTTVWRTVAALGAASLALTACGGNGNTPADNSNAGGNPPTASSSETSAPSESPSESAGGGATNKGDGTLTIGTLLPQTGDLAFLGPPEFAGVNAAIKDINAAGGVLGKPVKKIDSDSGDAKSNIAPSSVNRLLSQNVDAIIGAASSGVSLNVIDKIVNAGVVHFSPANTSPVFTTYNDKGLYFRTAPSDVLQGRVMADLVVNDGASSVGILVRDDSYGKGLADAVNKGVTGGGGEVTDTVTYSPDTPSFGAQVTQIKQGNPDAVVVIGFNETTKIIPEMIKQGIGPKQTKIYFVDGNLADYSKDLPPGSLTGVKGTLPGADSGGDFRKKLLAVDPKLDNFSYGPESYDATVLTALAAIAAKSDAGVDIAKELPPVSKDGQKCKSFKECADLLKNGKDIDYDGYSGPIEFSDAGDPTQATIGIYQYDADNTYKNLTYQSGKV